MLRSVGATLALALALLCAPASFVAAQEPDRGLFGISPAKLLLETEPPRNIRPLQLTNTTELTYDVEIFAAPLVQAADGGLTYDDSAEGLALGKRTLRLGATRYTMPPNSRRDLALRWLRTFPDSRVAPMGVVVEGKPRGAEEGSLTSRYRIVGTYLLRLPDGGRDGEFTGLEAEQGPEKALVFTPKVRNSGEVYDEPKEGRLIIRDSSGKTVTRKSFKSALMLPGGERSIPVTIKKILPAGDYKVVAQMIYGGGKREISEDFRLVGPNELPTTRLEIADLKGVAFAGDPATGTVLLRNTGTLRADARVRLRLREVSKAGGSGGGTTISKVSRLEPEDETTISFSVGDKLKEVNYEITAVALVGDEEFDSASITITPRPKRTLGDWFSDNALWLILLLALLVVAAMAEYTRRMRKRMAESAPAAPGAPVVPVAADTAERLDLNAATARQLAKLPGVGPKTAQAIVDFRAENGPFASVADLEDVGGFGPARVARLEQHLRV